MLLKETPFVSVPETPETRADPNVRSLLPQSYGSKSSLSPLARL